jgi:uncharacterized membrane protein YhaH (DUF805 family)
MDFAYLYTSLDGRINRKPYWLGVLILLAVAIPVQLVAYFVAGMTASTIVGFIFLWPSFALAVKRAQDRNRPMWIIAIFFALVLIINVMELAGISNGADGQPTTIFSIISIVFLIGAIYVFIDIGLLRGTRGPNPYGPDPLGG